MDRREIDHCSWTGVSGAVDDDPTEDQARLIQQARQVVYRTPEVRPEKVNRLIAAVDRGSYEIDLRKVTNRLIDEELLRKR